MPLLIRCLICDQSGSLLRQLIARSIQFRYPGRSLSDFLSGSSPSLSDVAIWDCSSDIFSDFCCRQPLCGSHCFAKRLNPRFCLFDASEGVVFSLRQCFNFLLE
jgi:hypothetical protein